MHYPGLVWGTFRLQISLIHVCLYACLCVHLAAETLDSVAELPDTQMALQTDVKETYYTGLRRSNQ